MKNLKKVLALVLAFACAFTMFAGAAFTDAADFAVDTDVVDTLVALGVVNGYEDGSFKPDDTVTRAEMAKMIYVVRTGRSDASAYNDDKTTFTDINNHWARGYIKYCQALGIIAGKSATKFDPDATVTTAEAAKMLLVTLGYNAEKAGLVGGTWASKTVALADENGLLKDVNCGTTSSCPRQFAAQLIYNTIFTPTVALRDGEYTNMNLLGTGKLETVGEKFMDLVSYKTTLVGYNDKVIVLASNDGQRFNDYTVDHSDLVGRGVKVLYKAGATRNDKATIYGIFEDDDYSYTDTIVGKVTDLKTDATTSKKTIKVNGTKEDVASTATATVTGWTNTKSAQPITVIYNDKGDVYDLDADAYFKVAKISYVGSKKVTIGTDSRNIEDIELYDGYKKDDWTVRSYNEYTDKFAYAKADVFTGKVEVVNGSDVTIDGTTYTKADDAVSLTGLDLGNTVKVVVVDKYIYNAEKVSGIASLDEVVYIKGAKVNNDYGKETVKAKATFANGSKAEIRVVEVEGKYVDTNTSTDDSESKIITAIKDTVTPGKGNASIDGLYAFELDGEKYTLKNITYGTSSDDFDGRTTTASAGDDKIGGERVNDEAVVFVVDKDGDVYVKTGKDVKAWSKNTAVTSVVAYGDKTSGYIYVDLAAIVLNNISVPGASYDAVYGYVVKELGDTKEDNKKYTSFLVWTGAADETIKVETSKVGSGVVKGSFVKVEDDAIAKVGTVAAISGCDAETVSFVSVAGEYNITKDTKVIFVDTDADVVAGVEGGEIKTATDHKTSGTKENNVVYVVDSDDTNASDGTDLAVLFVDVNNEMVAK